MKCISLPAIILEFILSKVIFALKCWLYQWMDDTKCKEKMEDEEALKEIRYSLSIGKQFLF